MLSFVCLCLEAQQETCPCHRVLLQRSHSARPPGVQRQREAVQVWTRVHGGLQRHSARAARSGLDTREPRALQRAGSREGRSCGSLGQSGRV